MRTESHYRATGLKHKIGKYAKCNETRATKRVGSAIQKLHHLLRKPEVNYRLYKKAQINGTLTDVNINYI